MKIVKYFVTLFAVLMPYFVCAAPVCWKQNGHCYERVDEPFLSWFEAKNGANSMTHQGITGHLATISSQQENDFITNNFRSPIPILLNAAHFWLGAFQPPGSSEPDGNWQWITGEPFSYTNWNAGEPNNVGVDDKNALEIYLYQASRLGTWNDDLPRVNNYVAGYIVEYPMSSKTQYIDLTHLDDINGNNYHETAVLRRLSNGHPQVVIRENETNNKINFIGFFNPNWEARGVDALDVNGDNIAELAVLGVRKSDGKISVEIRDAITDAVVNRITFFNKNWEAKNLTVGTVDNSGILSISVLAKNMTNGNVEVEIRDAVTGVKIKRNWFGKNH